MVKNKESSQTLEMRELTGGDVFPILEIIEKLGLVEQAETMIPEIQEETKVVQEAIVNDLIASGKKREEITAEDLNKDPRATALNTKTVTKIVKIVVRKVPLAKKEINALLADLTDTSSNDIKKLPLKTYFGLITAFFKKPELGELVESISSFV